MRLRASCLLALLTALSCALLLRGNIALRADLHAVVDGLLYHRTSRTGAARIKLHENNLPLLFLLLRTSTCRRRPAVNNLLRRHLEPLCRATQRLSRRIYYLPATTRAYAAHWFDAFSTPPFAP